MFKRPAQDAPARRRIACGYRRALRVVVTILCATCYLFFPAIASSSPPARIITDWVDDAVIRRTDIGNDDPINETVNVPIDLHEIVIGSWTPDDPSLDIFAGQFDTLGEFFRLDVTFGGLVCPPGETDPLDFQPFRFGERPVFGFIEIDMDADVMTGGEIFAPEFRYLGNIARFGGRPTRPEFADRVAVDQSAFDNDVLTPPFVDRHGEEFHLTFLERALGDDITIIEGDVDETFEAGETWLVCGNGFHRAHAFEEFSFQKIFEPDTTVMFRHDVQSDRTTVSLVFRLEDDDNGGGASGCALNSFEDDSVFDGLEDLVLSADFLKVAPTGLPEEALISQWAGKNPAAFLNPVDWKVTAIVGISYTQPDPLAERFVWTDVVPNVRRGDFDGNGVSDAGDVASLQNHITVKDGDDGMLDGRVVIAGFSDEFSIYDLDFDGVVDETDTQLVRAPADYDGDGAVDLIDFGLLQRCFSGGGLVHLFPGCALTDLDSDGDVDGEDFSGFNIAAGGP